MKMTRVLALSHPRCVPASPPCRAAAGAVPRCHGRALPVPALSRLFGMARGRPAPPGAAAARLEMLKGCGVFFFFTFPQCHDFRFPPSKKREKQPTAVRPAAMEEPGANAEPPPGLRSLLPPREFLCSRKGRLLLAEAVRAAGGRLSGGRDGAESGDGAADRRSWKGGDGGRARPVRKPKRGPGYVSTAREPLLG